MRYDQHTVVLLVRPPDAPELPPDAAERLRDAHLAHHAGLVERGLVLAAGPFVDPDDERMSGFVMLPVGPDEARELYRDDPAVRAGRLVARVASWRVPEGSVRFGEVPIPVAMLEAAAGDVYR
ncbi:YciI family protein [Micromonospora sp. NPDC048830]|uniref:YciI family protein n=1 Tax=Micromonospora sp. NPDC048830 TaxID=3364257 RepID=UPI00371E69B7